MKKNFLWIAAAALAFAACANDENFSEVSNEGSVIAFKSYTEPTTKATENNTMNYAWDLEDHHYSFQVYGWRQVSGEATDVQVFNNQTVDYGTTTTDKWDYSPHRFWDKRATSYTFYAAAPADANWALVDNTDGNDDDNDAYKQGQYYFTYTGYTLVDHDATAADATTTADNYVQSFMTAYPDKDLMVAAPCVWTNIGNTVNLNFIHVLSRLNIIVQRGNKLSATDVVKIQKFEVVGFEQGGKFVENTRNADATSTKTASRWTSPTGTKITYTTTTDLIDEANSVEFQVDYDPAADDDATGKNDMKQYILQSLVVPQNIALEDIRLIDGKQTAAPSTNAAQAYLHIKYSIHNDDWTGDKTEVFEGYYNLATAFGAKADDGDDTNGVEYQTVTFNEGWQNNLTLIINPDYIVFDPYVSEWASNDFAPYDIK